MKYLQFSKDVRRLDERLRQLRDALGQALEQSEDLDLNSLGTHSRPNPLKRESEELIGDFNSTLKECREIMVSNVSLQRDRAGFIQNVVWGASTQKKVDDLRTRIQFHSQKIYLVIEPVHLRLATNIAGDVSEILFLMKQHLIPQQELMFGHIPGWLAARFCGALAKNAPPSYKDIAHFPLKEGFDALYRHFRQSTVQFIDDESGEQTIEQYLELLKAQWILETLKKSKSYREARPGSLYTRIIGQVEQRISKQFGRRDILKPSDGDLAKMNSSAFLVWQPAMESTSKRLLDQSGQEEKILELALSAPAGIRKHELFVFRRSATTLRLVRNVVEDDSGISHPESEKINVHVDRLIPWYAIPTSSPTWSVEICSGNETGGTTYDFRNETDIFNFQRAITGYQVVYDMPKLQWALNKQRLRLGSNLLEGVARVQIWLWKPLVPMQVGLRESPQLSTSPSSSNSGISHWTNTTNATVAKVTQRCDSSVVSVAENPNGDSVIAAATPHLPRIVIFTKIEQKYSFLSIERKSIRYILLDLLVLIIRPVHQGLRVVDTSCKCKKDPLSCRRSVIENRSGSSPGTFDVQKISVKIDQLETWDLAILGRPQHPNFRNADKVEHITCKFLNLDFPSVLDREKFNRDLKVALKLRDKDEMQIRKVSGNAEFLSHKPNHIAPTEKMTAFPLSRPSSMASDNNLKPSARTSSTAPLPGQFSQSPTFVGSPVLGTSYDKLVALPLSRESSAISSDGHTPATPSTSPRIPSFGRLSMSPVSSDSFPWTSHLEAAAGISADPVSLDTQTPSRPDLSMFPPVIQLSLSPADLEVHCDNFGWAVHSGDPWFPGKT